jgi:hypothetical protein
MHGHLNVTLKSHILLNAVIGIVCTFPTVLNCCPVRIDVGERKKLQGEISGKSANCPAWQMGNWVLYHNTVA